MAYTTIDTPESYFNIATYTGNGSTQSITGIGFQPDLIWIKSLNASGEHHICDSSRGTGKHFKSELNWEYAEQSSTTAITSFDSDGFSLGSDSAVNTNLDTYVAWCWKINGGTTETIAAGSPTYDPSESTVQKLLAAGITTSEYNGATSFGSYSHGLGQIPAWTMIKSKTYGGNAPITMLHNQLGYDNGLQLSTGGTYGSVFFDAAPTASVINCVDTTAVFRPTGTKSYIGYHFANIQGYQKFGLATGNSSTNGTFIYTGFKPKWFMIKRYDTTGNNYYCVDATRTQDSTSCVGNTGTNTVLKLNTWLAQNTQSEGTGTIYFDFLSNGVKMRSTDGELNGSLLYWAIAEKPFVSSTGIPMTAV